MTARTRRVLPFILITNISKVSSLRTQCNADDGSLRPFVLHRVDSGSASPQPWRVQGMLSTWCAAPRVVADFARFAPPRHSTMTMHEVNWAHLESLGVILQAKPSQREVGLTTTLITRLLTNQLAQSRSTADAGDQSPASGRVHHTGRLSMAWKRSGVRVP